MTAHIYLYSKAQEKPAVSSAR